VVLGIGILVEIARRLGLAFVAVRASEGQQEKATQARPPERGDQRIS
jgi:hypothetical protein